MKTGTLLRGATALIVMASSASGLAAPVALDTSSTANGITDLFSATFDGALSPCTGADPSYCAFFGGKPGPARNIIVTPDPTQVINGVPLGLSPVPVAGSFLDLTLNGTNTQVTLSGGTISFPALVLTISGTTVVNAGGAGVVFNRGTEEEPISQVAPINAEGQAEFLINLAPTVAVDFSDFTTIVGPNCTGPLCAVIPVLTLDMVRYRLFIDFDPTFSSFTADFIGQTGNNSILSITMNSVVASPEIEVATSVAFGDVTESASSTRTVTVTNTGTSNLLPGGSGNLLLGAVADADGLAPPFALINDNCTAATLAPAASCTFGVSFSPLALGNFSDTLDVPSNDADEPSVTVTVAGNGVAIPVPNISVSDSVAPTTDQSVPFGSSVVGSTALEQSVTVTNEGNGDLVLGTVASADGLLAPFSIFDDNCSGQTVAPAGSCTVGLRFEPTDVAASSDTFDIPSNDAATPSVVVTVSGTGTSPATPEITVTDDTLPADDLLVAFGNITEGTLRDRTITVTNSGGLDLVIGSVAVANPLAAPFSVEDDNCSTQSVPPAGTCTVVVRYAPSTTGASSDSLDIPSNDPDEPSVTVQLTGTGIAEGEGGVETPSPSGADGGFMAIDPATLLLLGGAGIWAWRRRQSL